MAKIILPRNSQKILELAQKIIDKHVADGDASPIKVVIEADEQQKITEGLQLCTQAEELEKQTEKTYEERDAKVKEVFESIKRIRDVLKGVYKDNLRTLGDYGFTVND